MTAQQKRSQVRLEKKIGRGRGGWGGGGESKDHYCTLHAHCTGVEAIVENLSQQLESSTPTEPSTKPEDPTVVKLADLRKQLLVQMTSQLHKAEEAGGMKNICFFQVCVYGPKIGIIMSYLVSTFVHLCVQMLNLGSRVLYIC